MGEQRRPERSRTYRNHHLDSTRWDSLVHRPDDIVISTSAKAGTTWMQRIVSLLVLGPEPLPVSVMSISPWVDSRVPTPVDDMVAMLERQEHRRFLKSHLPLDAIPYHDDVRYIFVTRDTRDVFMSLFNHYHSHTDEAYEEFASGDPAGGPLPQCPEDPREFWRGWTTRASFPWEHDGWPYWSHHYHASSFWEFRRLPNVLAVHYNDLRRDLEGQMRRVAAFLQIDVPDAAWSALVDAARFESMRAEAVRLEAAGSARMSRYWRGGAATFFYRGTNGRWRDVLTTDDLELYERAVSRLDPALRAWLESGSLVVGDPQEAS
jgi:aryl sulfotransferase